MSSEHAALGHIAASHGCFGQRVGSRGSVHRIAHLLQFVSVTSFGHAPRSVSQVLALAQSSRFAACYRMLAPSPNYALKRTVREEVSGAIMRCGPHGRLA